MELLNIYEELMAISREWVKTLTELQTAVFNFKLMPVEEPEPELGEGAPRMDIQVYSGWQSEEDDLLDDITYE